MLERLERADLAPELLPRLRVLDRHLEGALGAAEAVGRDADGPEIEEALEERPGLSLPAEQRDARHRDVAQRHLPHPARQVDRLLGPHAHAATLARHQEE